MLAGQKRRESGPFRFVMDVSNAVVINAKNGLTGGISDDPALGIQQSSSSRSSPAVYKTVSSALVISFKVLVGVPLRECICLHVEADVVGLFGHFGEADVGVSGLIFGRPVRYRSTL